MSFAPRLDPMLAPPANDHYRRPLGSVAEPPASLTFVAAYAEALTRALSAAAPWCASPFLTPIGLTQSGRSTVRLTP